MKDAQNHVPEPLSQLQKQGLITLHGEGLEYLSDGDVIFVSWAEAASAAQIAKIRVSSFDKSGATSGACSATQDRTKEKC